MEIMTIPTAVSVTPMRDLPVHLAYPLPGAEGTNVPCAGPGGRVLAVDHDSATARDGFALGFADRGKDAHAGSETLEAPV